MVVDPASPYVRNPGAVAIQHIICVHICGVMQDWGNQ